MKLLAIIVLLIALSSCAAISFAPSNEDSLYQDHKVRTSLILDEDGNVIVRSGSHRDNRRGYYFDTKERVCKEVFYSTGPGCVPPH